MKQYIADEYNVGMRLAKRVADAFGIDYAGRLARSTYNGTGWEDAGFRAYVQANA